MTQKNYLKKMKILDFENFYEFTTGKFMWTLSNDLLPGSIQLLFMKPTKVISGHEHDFLLPTINSEIKKRFISFNGIKIWRKIPSDLKAFNTFKGFKKGYSKYLQSIH